MHTTPPIALLYIGMRGMGALEFHPAREGREEAGVRSGRINEIGKVHRDLGG